MESRGFTGSVVRHLFCISAFLWVLPSLQATPSNKIAISVNAPPADPNFVDGNKHPAPFPIPGAAGLDLAGRVDLRVNTTAKGEVRKVSIARSSGSKLLDEAARAWVASIWKYPAASNAQEHQESIVFENKTEVRRSEEQGAAAGRKIYPDTPRPPYPYLARRQGWQGDVEFALAPDGKGGVRDARLLHSSGNSFLDLMTIAWAKAHWKLSSNQEATAVLSYRLPGAVGGLRPVR